MEVPKTRHLYNKKNYSNNDYSGLQKLLDNDFNEEVINKHAARVKFLHKRKNLKYNDVQVQSRLIAKKLISHNIFKDSKDIALYHPIKNEVETILLHKKARELGKNIYYPRISGDLITFHKVYNIAELKAGAFNLLEPDVTKDPVSLYNIDLFILPGLCFDLYGSRIGYGMGYYDRSLISINKNKKIGLAYSFQIINFINTDKDDLPVGYIVTENDVIDSNEGGH